MFLYKFLSFGGSDNDWPIRFLIDLNNYLQILQPEWKELRLLLYQCVENAARNWYYLIEDSINSYEVFVNKFKDRFWNNNFKKRVRKKVECGHYHNRRKLNCVYYATYILAIAKDLEISIQNSEFISAISKYFEKEIKLIFMCRNINNIKDLLQFLSYFDEEERIKKKFFYSNI